MSISARPSTTRRRRALLGAVALATGMLALGTTAAVTAAGASASAGRTPGIAYGEGREEEEQAQAQNDAHDDQPVPVTNETPPSGSVGISEEGSTLLLPLFELWSTAYHQQHPSISLVPGGGGSGKGITDAASGVVDIGASDAYLSSSQLSRVPGHEEYRTGHIGPDDQLQPPVLPGPHQAERSGHLRHLPGQDHGVERPRHPALNPGLAIPADKIVALHRSDSSGDTFIFSSYLSAADPSGWGASIGYGTSISFPSISNSLGESGNAGMLTGCQATPGCIAYIGISYESKAAADGLGLAAARERLAQLRAAHTGHRPGRVPGPGGQDAAERDAVDDLRLPPPTATPSSTTSTASSRPRKAAPRWPRPCKPSFTGPSTPTRAATARSWTRSISSPCPPPSGPFPRNRSPRSPAEQHARQHAMRPSPRTGLGRPGATPHQTS